MATTYFLLPEPEVQFCDANGVPYAGGTITTYVPGTTTPANTWQDSAGTVLNTNPIILDAAGRAIIWGQGDYRFVLQDADGNLIYDQVSTTPPPPVDITALENQIQAETNRAEAAESNLQSQITAEVNRAEAAENTLTTNLNAEIARAEAAEAHLQSQITATQKIQYGNTSTGTSGHVRVTYGSAYTSTPGVTATVYSTGFELVVIALATDTSGFDAWSSQPAGGITAAPNVGFYWIAVGT